MRSRSVIAAALVAGLAVAGQAAAAGAQPGAQHRKLSQGIDEGEVAYEIFVQGAENLLDGGFGGIDGEDFAGDLLGPIFVPFANSIGQGIEYVLQPVYQVFQQVPGLGVCN